MISQSANSQVAQSKRSQQIISKYQYYLQNVIQSESSHDQRTLSQHTKPKTAWNTYKNERGMVFLHRHAKMEGVPVIDQLAIMESAKKVYLDSTSQKIGKHAYMKSHESRVPYFFMTETFSETIEFVLIEHQTTSQPILSCNSLPVTPRKDAANYKQIILQKQILPLKSSISLHVSSYQLYVIHHPVSTNPKHLNWLHYVQHYRFHPKEQSQQNGTIEYQVIASYEKEDGMIGKMLGRDCMRDHFIKGDSETSNQIRQLAQMQGWLLQSQDRLKAALKISSDPAFSQEHRRQLKLPMQHYKSYQSLKKVALKYYYSLHPTQSSPPQYFSNLLIRYLIANDYSLSTAQSSTLQYLKWEHQMCTDYSLQMFQDLHDFDVYTYLGEDDAGRVVILNKASHVKIDQIDADRYSTYYIYYLEIFLQKKMRGYVDQITIIADLTNLSSSNFKFAVTKRNVADSLKYSPERQYKLIAVNVSAFAYTIWRFIQPLLPKKTLSKISIIGTDKKEIVDALMNQMPIDIIPQYLGGRNKKVYSMDFEDCDQSQEKSQSASFSENSGNISINRRLPKII